MSSGHVWGILSPMKTGSGEAVFISAWKNRWVSVFLVGLVTFCMFMGQTPCYAGEKGFLRVPPSLRYILLKAGISKETVARCLGTGGGKIRMDLILKNLRHRERKEDYRLFLTKNSIDASQRFIRRYHAVLAKISRRYGVPREIVVAILQVESALGRHHERYRVLDVYVSLSALTDSRVRRKIVRWASRNGFPIHTRDMARRIDRKARWGTRQLISLLRAEEKGRLDALALKGSWAGAFGMTQFIPTSLEAYGVDWDRDGRIRLDRMPDAAASVAYYLKANGWKGPMDRKKKLTVIKKYNHSRVYAETILEISRRLKK